MPFVYGDGFATALRRPVGRQVVSAGAAGFQLQPAHQPCLFAPTPTSSSATLRHECFLTITVEGIRLEAVREVVVRLQHGMFHALFSPLRVSFTPPSTSPTCVVANAARRDEEVARATPRVVEPGVMSVAVTVDHAALKLAASHAPGCASLVVDLRSDFGCISLPDVEFSQAGQQASLVETVSRSLDVTFLRRVLLFSCLSAVSCGVQHLDCRATDQNGVLALCTLCDMDDDARIQATALAADPAMQQHAAALMAADSLRDILHRLLAAGARVSGKDFLAATLTPCIRVCWLVSRPFKLEYAPSAGYRVARATMATTALLLAAMCTCGVAAAGAAGVWAGGAVAEYSAYTALYLGLAAAVSTSSGGVAGHGAVEKKAYSAILELLLHGLGSDVPATTLSHRQLEDGIVARIVALARSYRTRVLACSLPQLVAIQAASVASPSALPLANPHAPSEVQARKYRSYLVTRLTVNRDSPPQDLVLAFDTMRVVDGVDFAALPPVVASTSPTADGDADAVSPPVMADAPAAPTAPPVAMRVWSGDNFVGATDTMLDQARERLVQVMLVRSMRRAMTNVVGVGVMGGTKAGKTTTVQALVGGMHSVAAKG